MNRRGANREIGGQRISFSLFILSSLHGLPQSGFGILRVFLHFVYSLHVASFEMQNFAIFHGVIFVQMPRHVAEPRGTVVAIAAPVRFRLGMDPRVSLNLALPFPHVRAKMTRIDALLVLVISDGVGGGHVVGPSKVNV